MTHRHHAALAGLTAALFATSVATAQPAATQQIVRGTVTAVQPGALLLKGRDGKPITVNLAEAWTVVVMKAVPVSEIQPGSFIGTAEMPQKDGNGRSLEVHVFPPGVKMGEGHYGWDLKKGSMMTNGTVGTVVAGKKGSRQLEVNYSYGKRTITVPANVPIVQITGGTRAMVKVGTPVFMVVQKAANGQLMAGSVSVGENGKAPAM
jgi:hypothetical protein